MSKPVDKVKLVEQICIAFNWKIYLLDARAEYLVVDRLDKISYTFDELIELMYE